MTDYKHIFSKSLELIDGAMDTQNESWRNTPEGFFVCKSSLPDSGYHYLMIDGEGIAFCFYEHEAE